MDQPNSYTFTIDKENQSTRIDSVLSLLLPETSRSFIQKLIEGGNLLLNGQVMTSKKYKTCEGDRIEIIVPEPEKLSVEPENIPLDIVYEDDDVLVVNKPKGMVVHPAVACECDHVSLRGQTFLHKRRYQTGDCSQDR